MYIYQLENNQTKKTVQIWPDEVMIAIIGPDWDCFFPSALLYLRMLSLLVFLIAEITTVTLHRRAACWGKGPRHEQNWIPCPSNIKILV